MTPKKNSPLAADLEPLEANFLDDEDDDAPPAPVGRVQPLARNVGALLDEDGEAHEPEPAPVFATAPTQPAPAPKKSKKKKPAAETDATHAASIYWQEAKRVGPAHAKSALLHKLHTRLQQHRAEMERWGSLAPDVVVALSSMDATLRDLASVCARLENLPVGWTPEPRATASSAPKTLPPGTIVDVRDGHRAGYEGALEPSEMVGLSVVRHEDGKPKVVCTTREGSRVVIPRAHLVVSVLSVVSPAEEADSSEEEPASE